MRSTRTRGGLARRSWSRRLASRISSTSWSLSARLRSISAGGRGRARRATARSPCAGARAASGARGWRWRAAPSARSAGARPAPAATLKARATTATSSSPASSTRSDSSPAPQRSTPVRRPSSRRVSRAVSGKAASPTPPATISTIERMRSADAAPAGAAGASTVRPSGRSMRTMRGGGRTALVRPPRARSARPRAATSEPCGVVDGNVGVHLVAEPLHRGRDRARRTVALGDQPLVDLEVERAQARPAALADERTRTRPSAPRRRRGSPAASDRSSRTAGAARRS